MPSRRFYPHLVPRRDLLRAAGATAALAPFLPLMDAHGQQAAFPKRLVLFYTPHGTIYEGWRPTGSGSNFTLGPILQPLARHQGRLNVIDGLQILPGEIPCPPHTECMGRLWTGGSLTEGNAFAPQGFPIDWVDGPSVDQVIASRLPQSPLGSLELGVQCNGSGPNTRMIFSGAKQPRQPEQDPWRAFGNIFAGLGDDPASNAAYEALQKRRGSVLDAVRGQLSGLAPQVSGDDARKIAAHLGGIRDLEVRLQAGAPASCTPPELGEPADSAPETLKAQCELLAMTLACGQTHVGSIQMKFGDNDNATYPWLGVNEGHHTLTHEGDGNQGARNALTSIYTWYAEQLASFLDRLADIPEGDGSVLDNTLVVWGSELGKGNTHSFERIPFLTAGGSNLIETGRFLSFDGMEHNRLLVSICHALGLSDIGGFGSTDQGNGPLPGLA